MTTYRVRAIHKSMVSVAGSESRRNVLVAFLRLWAVSPMLTGRGVSFAKESGARKQQKDCIATVCTETGVRAPTFPEHVWGGGCVPPVQHAGMQVPGGA